MGVLRLVQEQELPFTVVQEGRSLARFPWGGGGLFVPRFAFLTKQ